MTTEAQRLKKAEYHRQWKANNPDKVAAYRKKETEKGYTPEQRQARCAYMIKWQQDNPEKSLWLAAKRRAKKSGVPFTIEVSDIVIPETCPLLGIPIIRRTGQGHKGNPGAPSLDQICPGEGYTPDNIMVVSKRANAIKSDATPDELITIATNLRKHL